MQWQSEDEIRRILSQQERRIGEVFRLAINEYLNDVQMGRVIELLNQGRINEALDGLIDISRATVSASQTAFIAAAEATAKFIHSGNRVTIGFDQTNQRALAVMNRNKLEFIRGFEQSQRRATFLALQTGIQEGVGPREIARRFRGSVGLTFNQQAAVDNYRRLLQRAGQDDLPRGLQREAFSRKLRDRRHDPRIARAIRERRPLSKTEIDRMVERYRLNYIKHRAENIARTESLTSVHGGQDAALDDAIDKGSINQDEINQRWNTQRDGRERDPHAELHGTSVPWGEPWVNSIGPIFHPGDRSADAANVINCRCARTIRIR